jgi:hypothetical protein
MNRESAKEHVIPLALLGIGVAILLFIASRLGGQAGVENAIPSLSASIGLGVVLMLVGAVITAKLIGISFGSPVPAVIKLAAIYVFPASLALLVNVAGFSWMINMALYFILLIYLFELDAKEALIFTGVSLLVQLIVGYLIVTSKFKP